MADEGEIEKVVTGIPGFDRVAEGGLPRGRGTLVTGTSGAGKSILEGTPVYTEGGRKPIEAVKEGERVLSLNKHTYEQEFREVSGSPLIRAVREMIIHPDSSGGGHGDTVSSSLEQEEPGAGSGNTNPEEEEKNTAEYTIEDVLGFKFEKADDSTLDAVLLKEYINTRINEMVRDENNSLKPEQREALKYFKLRWLHLVNMTTVKKVLAAILNGSSNSLKSLLSTKTQNN